MSRRPRISLVVACTGRPAAAADGSSLFWAAALDGGQRLPAFAAGLVLDALATARLEPTLLTAEETVGWAPRAEAFARFGSRGLS